MRADLSERLRQIMRGECSPETAVTPVTPVTVQPGYMPKPEKLQALHRLQVKNSSSENREFPAVTQPVPASSEFYDFEILGGVDLGGGPIPAHYLDGWAQLNCKKPMTVSETAWLRAMDDGQRFLDTWGWVCGSGWEWSAKKLLDPPDANGGGGLIWRLKGRAVVSYGPDHVRLDDDSIILKENVGGLHG